MKFKTHHGAVQRAIFETEFSPTHKWIVIRNDNAHQARQGFVWRLKKVKKTHA